MSDTQEKIPEFDLSKFPKEVVAIENKAVIEGLGKTNAQIALTRFSKFFVDISAYEEKVKAINITEITQVKEMKEARDIRLELKSIRVNADKVRKDLKAAVLVEGRMIDGIFNVIAGLTSPLEAKLEEQEKFAEKKEAERIAKVKQNRLVVLAVYEVVESPYIDLAKMTDVEFESYANSCRDAFHFKQENLKKEQERLAKEEADRKEAARLKEIEDARIREENAKLKAEAEAKEKALQEERERAEKARLEAEAEAQRELEAERAKAREKEEAEAKERARLQKIIDDENARKLEEVRKAQEAEEAKAKMGDDDKLHAFMLSIRSVELPKFEDKERWSNVWKARDLFLESIVKL